MRNYSLRLVESKQTLKSAALHANYLGFGSGSGLGFCVGQGSGSGLLVVE